MCEYSVLKAVVDQGQLSNPYSKKNSHIRRDGLSLSPNPTDKGSRKLSIRQEVPVWTGETVFHCQLDICLWGIFADLPPVSVWEGGGRYAD